MLNFLRRIPLFRDLEEVDLARVLAVARLERYAAGELVFREGEPVDALYLVREGTVTVFRDAPGKPQQVLARLREGGFFGETGLLERVRRIASARASAPTTVLRIDKGDLLCLLADYPPLELRLRNEVIRALGHGVSALMGLTRKGDVRIRLGVEVEAVLPDGARLPLRLENLSAGGLGVTGAPEAWRLETPVRFGLAPPGEPPILAVDGTVSWREGEQAGIAFAAPSQQLADKVHRALRRLLAQQG
jgi:CRP/FNR family transcriptional regulator, anaerobic regulatory protein